LGLPVRLIGGPGQENDCKRGVELIDGLEAKAVLADKAYDTENICESIKSQCAHIVIPSKINRIKPRQYDKDLYKERNLIERFFSKLKQFRRVATRYDKLLTNFMGFVKLAAIHIWLK
jgi:putative transposase